MARAVGGTNIGHPNTGHAGTCDRLWIAAGDDVVRLPVSLNPLTESDYRFTWESVLTTSWYYMNMYDVYKLYHSLKIFGQKLLASNQFIKVYYRHRVSTEAT
jgi:hypothetical protein